jgi:hypothetical protein
MNPFKELGIDLNALVGLHIDPASSQYKGLGKIAITRDESPSIQAAFGNSTLYPYLLCGDVRSETPQLEIFYRFHDERGTMLDKDMHAGLRSFRKRYIELGGTVQELMKKYYELFNEDLVLPR